MSPRAARRGALEFDLEPSERVLAKLAAAAKDFTPVWNEIADDAAAAERHRFDSPTKHLKASTLRRKASWSGSTPLVRTGHLRDQLTRRPFGVEHISPRQAEFGSNVGYAKYHWRDLRLDPNVQARWRERVRAYIEKAVAQS